MLCEMNRLLINTLDTHVIYLSFLQGSPEKSTFTNLSFIIFSVMNLYEHQSIYNPNMPIRGVIYFARLYEAYIKKHNLVQRFLNPPILSA